MSEKTYFRRCHICGGLNENKDENIEHCQFCGKAWAPFYFFNELARYTDADEVIEAKEDEFQPIVGLSTYW
jgi:hypothetical protein